MSEPLLVVKSSRFSLYSGLAFITVFLFIDLFFAAVIMTPGGLHLGQPLFFFILFTLFLAVLVRSVVKLNIRITFYNDRILVERPWFKLFPMKRHFRSKVIRYDEFDVLDLGQRGRGGCWWEFRNNSTVVVRFFFADGIFVNYNAVQKLLSSNAAHVSFVGRY